MTELPAAEEALRARVVTNTLAQLVAPAVRVVVGVTIVAILGRYLGVTGFGEYGVVVAIVIMLTNLLAEWGLETILVREIARHPELRAALIASALALQLALATLAYAAVIAVAVLSAYPADVRAALLVFGLTLFLAPVQMLTAHLMSDLRLARLVAPAVAGTLAQLALVLIVVALGGPLVAVVAAGAAAVLVEQGWTARIVLRELRLERPTLATWPMFVREAWSLGLATLVAAAARQAPVLLLSTFGMDAAGIYAAAEKVPTYLTRIPYALRATMYPLLARRWSERGAFAELLDRIVAGTLALTVPAAAAAAVLAPGIVVLLFGGEFAPAAGPFALLMAAFVLVALGILLDSALVAVGAQRTTLLIRVASSAALLGLLLVLVPGAGPGGAAVAVLLASAASVLMSAAAVARRGLILAVRAPRAVGGR